ncbi:MAG: hypothetical protein JWO56_1794 [Acidobacteria bacterium]|nr:hypothetical protein [Acidobacteriota bacterium]
MALRIRGDDPTRNRGEALVEIAHPDPALNKAPVDLSERTLRAWIYAPRGSAGPRSRRNGVQLFAKDSQWRSLYGPWNNIETEDGWFALELPVNGATASHVDRGYDATKIVAIGVKFAAGGGSSATYDGPIYIDDVDW